MKRSLRMLFLLQFLLIIVLGLVNIGAQAGAGPVDPAEIVATQ